MAIAPLPTRTEPLRPPKPRKPVRESVRGWRRADQAAFLACWAAGLLLCVVAATIVGYMAVQGVRFLNLELLISSPQASLKQDSSGGFLDPIIGTVLLTVIGILVATPLAVISALWLVEYGQPRWLARIVESAIEVIAGTPSIVIAIFGLALFQHDLFAVLSFRSDAGGVFGRSFVNAGLMMSFIALPLVFGATREGLQQIPGHVREASYGLGKTRIATIRRVLLPSVRSNISTGAALGMGRIAGDTAIVIVLLGATLQLEPEGGVPGANVLKGTGSTLTSYVYNNSPAGEGNAPQKAYAAALVLLVIVIVLNFTVDLIARRGSRTGGDGQRLGA